MNEFEIKEIIKAFAFGFTADQVAEGCDISPEDAEKLRIKYAAEIEKKAGESHE